MTDDDAAIASALEDLSVPTPRFRQSISRGSTRWNSAQRSGYLFLIVEKNSGVGGTWAVTTRDQKGREDTLTARAVISAVG